MIAIRDMAREVLDFFKKKNNNKMSDENYSFKEGRKKKF